MIRPLRAFELVVEDRITIGSPGAGATDFSIPPGLEPGALHSDTGDHEIHVDIEDHTGWAAVTVWLSAASADPDEHGSLRIGEHGFIIASETGMERRIEAPPGRYAINVEQRFDEDDRLHIRIMLSAV